jgi:hypothetical protein
MGPTSFKQKSSSQHANPASISLCDFSFIISSKTLASKCYMHLSKHVATNQTVKSATPWFNPFSHSPLSLSLSLSGVLSNNGFENSS